MQRILGTVDGRYQALDLPDPDSWVSPGVRWGAFDRPLTPAFWTSQAWMMGTPGCSMFSLGTSLAEELVFCLLGAHGAPADVGLAAARRVCGAAAAAGRFDLRQEQLDQLLREPLLVRGKPVRYRFAAQRARYLAAALAGLEKLDEGAFDDVPLRDALCTLPGIGPKTASWIVRNRRASNQVAILDVHIVRACEAMAVFPVSSDPARRYFDLERRFLDFCAATGTRASSMDAIMWATMRRLSRTMLKQLIDDSPRFDQLRRERQQENRI